MDLPEVSIIITNYNYGRYLSRAVRSCLKQANIACEVIVVDDCSTDNSIEMLQPFINDVRLIQLNKNAGVAAAANAGLKQSKGQFVIRVDADDFVHGSMAYVMKLFLEGNHETFCVACDYLLVDDYENTIEKKSAEDHPISCGIMYRRDLLLHYGGYNDDNRHREEEELRSRLGDKYKIQFLQIPFYRYRMHSNNKTKTKEYAECKVEA